MGAQAAGPQTKQHSTICSAGVRTYTSVGEVPAPYDTLTLPPSSPVRVASDEEAAAADLAMRGRAGSIGATGLIVSEVTENGDGGLIVHRKVVAVFVPGDSARAHQACKS